MLVVAVILNGTMVARAQTPEGRQACMNDAFQFCQEFIPDRERVFGCGARLVTSRRPSALHHEHDPARKTDLAHWLRRLVQAIG
jgi:hypothetical protein